MSLHKSDLNSVLAIEPHQYDEKIGHGGKRIQNLSIIKVGVKSWKAKLPTAIGAEKTAIEKKLDKVRRLAGSGFLTEVESAELKAILDY